MARAARDAGCDRYTWPAVRDAVGGGLRRVRTSPRSGIHRPWPLTSPHPLSPPRSAGDAGPSRAARSAARSRCAALADDAAGRDRVPRPAGGRRSGSSGCRPRRAVDPARRVLRDARAGARRRRMPRSSSSANACRAASSPASTMRPRPALRRAVPRRVPPTSLTARRRSRSASASICSATAGCGSAIRSTGISIRCGRGAAPRVHWSRLDPLDPATVGDSKVVWELNRHQWLVRLGAGVGADRRRALCGRRASARSTQWLDANPPGIGHQLGEQPRSGLPPDVVVAGRCCCMRDSPVLSGAWVMTLLAAIWQHATHVRRYLSYYFSPNTHLTGEALGLFYAGHAVSRVSRRGAMARARRARSCCDESRAQVSADGVHFEQSTCYHRYTVEIYLHFLLLAARNGVTRAAPTLVDATCDGWSIPGRRAPARRIDAGDRRRRRRAAAAARRGASPATPRRVRRRGRGVRSAGLRVGGRRAAPEVLWLLGRDGLRRVRRAAAGAARRRARRGCFRRRLRGHARRLGRATRTS